MVDVLPGDGWTGHNGGWYVRTGGGGRVHIDVHTSNGTQVLAVLMHDQAVDLAKRILIATTMPRRKDPLVRDADGTAIGAAARVYARPHGQHRCEFDPYGD